MQSRIMAAPQNLKLPLTANAVGFMRKYKLPIAILLIHAPLGIVLMSSESLAAFHAYATLLVGLYFALQKRKSLDQIAPAAAYLVSSEVLWRMADAPIYWEYGKYAAALVMFAALAFRNRWKIPPLALLYFIFLLPACFLTAFRHEYAEAKDMLSFNMSGPFLLLVSCWFFSHVKLDRFQLRKILFWLIVPLLSVAVTTLFFTVTIENIRFTGESNRATSGGFGPNQVSAMLGLGVFVCVSCYLLFKNRPKEKFIFLALAVFLAAQSVMTFSRGGIYNAAGAIFAILLFQMKNVGQGFKQILAVGLLIAVFILAVFPRLNEFTGGALEARFTSTETTGRYEIAEADFMIFLENPVWGAGVGEAFLYRAKFFNRVVAAHTEFTRVVAEHGAFGVLALLFLALSLFFAVRRQKTIFGKAFAAGFIVWGMLFMFNSGMRLVAPSFILGMSFITFMSFRLKKRRKILQEKRKVVSGLETNANLDK